MTCTKSHPKQETFLNLPSQLFGCLHGNEAAPPAALSSVSTFPKFDMDWQRRAFVAPMPKTSLFSAQGQPHLFLLASPWFWKHLAQEGIYPLLLYCNDSGQGGAAAGCTSGGTGEGSAFLFGKKFWMMVRENTAGARSINKAERKKIQSSV